MRLLVTTPMSVIVDVENVTHVRAEDETGAFGIQQGHADFITALMVSVITWRNHTDEQHHIAVRGGVLMVRDGDLVQVATRDAVGEDMLSQLGDAVLERFRDDAAAEEKSRLSAARLHLAAIRQLQRYLESGRQPIIPQGSPPSLGAPTARDSLPGEGKLP